MIVSGIIISLIIVFIFKKFHKYKEHICKMNAKIESLNMHIDVQNKTINYLQTYKENLHHNIDGMEEKIEVCFNVINTLTSNVDDKNEKIQRLYLIIEKYNDILSQKLSQKV